MWMERFGDRWPVSYHNNHHQYGGRANFGGFRWHEVDPAYPLLKLPNALTVVKLRVGRDEDVMNAPTFEWVKKLINKRRLIAGHTIKSSDRRFMSVTLLQPHWPGPWGFLIYGWCA